MKKIFYITGFLAVLVFIAASCRDRYFHIRAQIENLPDGMVYLVRYDGNVEKIDSVYSMAGTFAFRQPGPLPDIYYVWFPGIPEFFFPVAVEGSELHVSGDFNSRDDISITGSPGNDAMAELRRIMRPYDIINRAIALDLQWIDPAGPDSLAYRELLVKRDSMARLIGEVRRGFVRAHRDNIVSALLAANAVTDSTTRRQVDSLLHELDPAMPDNAFLTRLRERLETDR